MQRDQGVLEGGNGRKRKGEVGKRGDHGKTDMGRGMDGKAVCMCVCMYVGGYKWNGSVSGLEWEQQAAQGNGKILG